MEKRTEPNAPLPWRPHLGWGKNPNPVRHGGPPVASGAQLPSVARRSVPMEGVVLYRKAIDNSSVKYRHDPTDRYALRRHVSMGLFVVLLSLIATSPRLWVRHSGYRQAQLTETVEQLVAVREHLKVEKGRLENLQRVAALAADLGLGRTEDTKYTWTAQRRLGGGPEPTVAELFVHGD